MTYTTYYFGAGASIEALPLYNNFSKRLKIYADYIAHNNLELLDEGKRLKYNFYVSSLDNLINILNNGEHKTLDMYAEYLYKGAIKKPIFLTSNT